LTEAVNRIASSSSRARQPFGQVIVAADISEPMLAALKEESQLLVIEAQHWVRPNSPVQTINVLSSRPRCLSSEIKAAIG
jgi:hypothetical protein